MKKTKLIKVLVVLWYLCLITSCNCEDEWSNIHELSVRLESEFAMVNEPIEFTDLSLGISSRTWTFEDAVPSVSTNPVVKVSFNKSGKKKYSLTVQYDNGKSETMESVIDVKEQLTAKIMVPSATPMGCVRLNDNIQFIPETTNEEAFFEWSFPGGIPASSKEKTPTVVWKEKGFKEVSLKVTRKEDNAEITVVQKIHVGPYPMLRIMSEFDTDSWNAEDGSSIGAWIIWNGSSNIFSPNVAKRANIGANGTAHSIQITYDAVNDWQFFPRDMWVSNAKLEKGKKYEFCFYAKSSVPSKISELILINAVFDYMYDGVVNAAIASDWNKYYSQIPLSYTSGETRYLYDSNMAIDENWKLFRYEFTVGDIDITGANVPDLLLNVYPFFIFKKSDGPADIYIDEIEINLLEE